MECDVLVTTFYRRGLGKTILVSAVSYTYDQGTNRVGYRTSMSDYGSGSTSWGLAGDIPVPGDYDGDGASSPKLVRRGGLPPPRAGHQRGWGRIRIAKRPAERQNASMCKDFRSFKSFGSLFVPLRDGSGDIMRENNCKNLISLVRLVQ